MQEDDGSLHLAALEGDAVLVRTLLQCGADVRVADKASLLSAYVCRHTTHCYAHIEYAVNAVNYT